MDGPISYALAQPLAAAAAIIALAAGCAWFTLAGMLRRSNGPAIQDRRISSRLEITALLTGAALLLGAAAVLFD